MEDDLIRLTRTGGHWRFIDSHTSHRYRRRPALDWDRRHALGQSHHTGGVLEASLVRYTQDRVILIRSAANFIRSAASVHWRGAVDWPAVDASGGLSHFWQALSKHRGSMHGCRRRASFGSVSGISGSHWHLRQSLASPIVVDISDSRSGIPSTAVLDDHFYPARVSRTCPSQ
jgi:hypothetical protein